MKGTDAVAMQMRRVALLVLALFFLDTAGPGRRRVPRRAWRRREREGLHS
jgi:hypothetical protein